jgi:AcrR family transcriptional regulator
VDDQTAVVTRRGETYGGRSRAQRATDRRDRIVASAVHLFGTRDYESITVADVCAGARVSKRYFYEHFADRADLVIAVNREQNEWLLGSLAAAAPKSPAGPEEVLRPAMQTLVQLLQAYPERARVIYINAPRMETRRREVLRSDADFLSRLLRRPAARPEEKLRFDRTLLALVAGVSEVIIDWISRDMADDPDLLAEHLTGIGLALLNS